MIIFIIIFHALALLYYFLYTKKSSIYFKISMCLLSLSLILSVFVATDTNSLAAIVLEYLGGV